MKHFIMLLLAPLAFATPCLLPLPGENYTSSACSRLEPVTIAGEWFVDPQDWVAIDFNVCTRNEVYVAGGVVIAHLYDGAPRGNCASAPVLPPETPIVPVMPAEPVAVPEPATWALAAIGLIAIGRRRG